MKLWWVHNEAMIAFLMAYGETAQQEHLERFAQVFDYSYAHVSGVMKAMIYCTVLNWH